MTNINNDTSNTNNTNNTNNQDRLDLSGGNVEHVATSNPEAQCLLNAGDHRCLLKSPNVQRRSRESASPRSRGRGDGSPRRRPDPVER